MYFFFNDTATTEIYTLSLHDALPIWFWREKAKEQGRLIERLERASEVRVVGPETDLTLSVEGRRFLRSEEHTSELQSRQYLVCRLLLEKKNHHKPSIQLRPRAALPAA